jgi:hypothetical protein
MNTIQVTSTKAVTRRDAQLALFQHFVQTYIDERTGDLKPITFSSYKATTVKAILSTVFKQGNLRISETYLGEGGYTEAYNAAKLIIDKVFPEKNE